MRPWLALITAFLFVGSTSITPAGAQGVPMDEPPLIAGRVALAEGDALIWRVEEDRAGQWDTAIVNDVVSVGTGLYIGADGRSEVRVGPNSYRLGPNSRGGFSQLDYAASVFNLEYGTLNVRLARPEHGETAAVTAGGTSFYLAAPGRYRIDAIENGPMRLTVFEGHGTVRGRGSSTGVAAGQAVAVSPGGAAFSFEQPITTGFDQWALSRDERYAQAGAPSYVSPYMTGYEDLNVYGDWVADATYGEVWYPRAVPVGWAPYRHGQWRWVPPWGWTWVDYAPWGYAPFHYGRWVMIGPRWCWVPGGYVRRPVWAPALVGFVGGVSVTVGVGTTVGWYPLAPWNRYEPHYRHNPTYVTVINQTVINNPPPGVPRTINQGPGATIVPGPRFREPINRVALPVRPRPEQLKPVAPPPLNVAPAPRPSIHKFSDERRPPETTPSAAHGAQPAPPPTRVTPPITAEPMPGRGVAPQPPLPGNNPAPMAQPPGQKRGQPVAPQPATPPPSPVPDRPAPRAHVPGYQGSPSQPQPTNPAEPPRFPPEAPPTIKQPQPKAPAARPVHPAPPVPAPTTHPAPARPAPTGPVPGAAPQPRPHPAPTQKEQVLRNAPEQGHGKPVEREAPAPRPKQTDR